MERRKYGLRNKWVKAPRPHHGDLYQPHLKDLKRMSQILDEDIRELLVATKKIKSNRKCQVV